MPPRNTYLGGINKGGNLSINADNITSNSVFTVNKDVGLPDVYGVLLHLEIGGAYTAIQYFYSAQQKSFYIRRKTPEGWQSWVVFQGQ